MSGASNRLRVDEAALKGISRGPLPGSRKVYVPGERYPFLRVPMREISLSPTRHGDGPTARLEANPPVTVYDTTGPYTDPEARIDLERGLAPIRLEWIGARGDTVELEGVSSGYGREREADPRLAGLRFQHRRRPRMAKGGGNVTQLHYARKGIIT
ncbi:MAG TPA: phosphomethylpyrimidine synthase ThiC, partial [Myxococcales bacterium]|nr:phosphomethylpyrimidine synthase ThiC [Myxococcales bacterium]